MKIYGAVLGVVLASVSCSTSTEIDHYYDVNASWYLTTTIASNPCDVPDPTVSVSGVSLLFLQQKGTTISTLESEGNPSIPGDYKSFDYYGICDPEAGTFRIEYVFQGATYTWEGHDFPDPDNMAGTLTYVKGDCRLDINWTAKLSMDFNY